MALTCSEIIQVVLRHLQNPLYLIACSVVSPEWHSAYEKAQISSLHLSTAKGRKHLYGLLRWMQAQQERGNFCQLTTLTIAFAEYDDEYDDDSNEKYLFSGAVIMLAGFWPLQEVKITGAFDFDMALELLPGSVKHLKLCPNILCFPDIVHLERFSRFTALQTLTVYPFTFGEDPPCLPGNCFLLGGALANLASMTLSSWPLILKGGCSITSCLPNLKRASVHLHVDLVNAFTSSDQFKVLILVLVDPTPLPDNHSVRISVNSTSKLKKLVLGGPLRTFLLTLIDLQVKKPGVELLCGNVTFNFVSIVSSSMPNDNCNSHRFDELHDFPGCYY